MLVLASHQKLFSFAADPPCQLHVLDHDSNPICMDSAKICIFKKSHQVSLACFLQGHQSGALKTQIWHVIMGDTAHKPLKGELLDEQVSTLLIPPNLPQSHCARPVPMWFLYTPSCVGRLASCFSCQPNFGRFPLSASHGNPLSTSHPFLLFQVSCS